MDKRAAKIAKLQALSTQFCQQLPHRMQEIAQAWQQVKQADNDQSDSINTLLHLIHSLAGSAGTFGYIRLGEKARYVELELQQRDLEKTNNSRLIDEALQHLQQLSEQKADENSYHNKIEQSIEEEISEGNKDVYILEDNTLLASEIVKQLEYFGYQACAYETAQALRKAYQQKLPVALIADIVLPDGDLKGPKIAKELNALSNKNIPVIFISVRSDWLARLTALRAGGVAYISKPIDFSQLVEQLDKLSGRTIEHPYRVLVVDDTPLLAEHYATVLKTAGMETQAITDPAKLLDTLAEFPPDFILMDIYMPHCTGIEAAQVIRQHSSYQSLPIVYLSTEGALQKQLEALSVGGDDFLKKPISDTHLITAVSTRAKRFRELNALMTQDSLTGLLNHINLKLALERELACWQRHERLVNFVMIDIDKFKQVNDEYGHPIGDRVIKSLARLLSQRLRKTDVVARYGGEEFAIVLTNINVDQAYVLVDGLRETFSKLEHVADIGMFKCTFSAGIAQMSVKHDMFSLIKSADEALYQAKSNGRNQVVVYS